MKKRLLCGPLLGSQTLVYALKKKRTIFHFYCPETASATKDEMPIIMLQQNTSSLFSLFRKIVRVMTGVAVQDLC